MDDLRQYLRTRWSARTRVLAGYALVSSLLFGALDVLFGRWLPPVSLHTALVVRGPFILIPVVGWMVQRIAPRSRALPAATIVLSIAWTWGNDWAFFALGSSNSALHLAWLVGCYITVATYMPVMTPGRIGVFLAMMGGHLALDLASPQARPIGLRICSDGVLFALVAVEVTVVEKLRVSRWRGWQLQRELEESARRAEESRRRAAQSAEAVRQLAAAVAHDVNSPLAAVKANVGWLGEPAARSAEEREEVVKDTVDAVNRIARIVFLLKEKAKQER